MPLHKYKCNICDTEQEILYRGLEVTVPDEIDCTNCGSPAYKALSSFNAPSSSRGSAQYRNEIEITVEVERECSQHGKRGY